MSTGTVRACERSIVGSDAAGGDGDDVPPPPVERAPGGSVLRASTPWGVQHRSTEHRAVGGNRMARGTGDGEGDIGGEGGGRREGAGGGGGGHGVAGAAGGGDAGLGRGRGRRNGGWRCVEEEKWRHPRRQQMR